ncbi:hypothetical protein [Brevibacterium album]|uniref:hypothetical protein n=1 Tax=Brevibacterium album TaxID=417948 RepID=UPI0003FC495F|nr:hypothetical protein [Brevibacterium album]
MSLTELLSPERAEERRHPVEVVLDMLEGEEREAVVAALKNPAFPNRQIADALQQVGYDVTNKQVGAYRSKHRVAQFAKRAGDDQ